MLEGVTEEICPFHLKIIIFYFQLKFPLFSFFIEKKYPHPSERIASPAAFREFVVLLRISNLHKFMRDWM